MIESYPLTWPDGWKRTPASERVFAKFGKREQQRYNADGSRQAWRRLLDVTINDGMKRLLRELESMGIDREDVIISTNLPVRLDGLPKSNTAEPSDPGAAVYWRASENQPMKCMAIDRYTKVADNLAALAATLDAMRAIERHGGAEILERAFRGFAALPEKASSPWRDVLGFGHEAKITVEDIEAKFRDLVQTHHPDHGGDEDRFRLIVEARSQGKKELSGR